MMRVTGGGVWGEGCGFRVAMGLYFLAGIFGCLVMTCHGQWRTQDIELSPGWNAVYLEVQPTPAACDAVFTNPAIETVWKWDRRFSSIEYVVDPGTLLPEDPHWLMWFPSASSNAFLSRLRVLEGSQSYLVKVATNAVPFSLPVKGGVILPSVDWYPHSLNLVGFPVNPANPPMFSSFLRYTPEIDTSLGFNNQLFRIDASGRGVTIVQPARERMAAGTAYWVGCARAPASMGPIDIAPSAGLSFGAVLSQVGLDIQNTFSATALTVRIVQQDSEAPPAGDYPELAGTVPLSYLARNASNEWEWNYWPVSGLTNTLAPDETWSIQVGVRRGDMAPYIPAGTNGYVYACILAVADAEQTTLLRIPVSAEKSASPLPEHDSCEGLWIGEVTLDRINAPAYDATNLLATTAPCAYRAIVHIDGYGQARLLQQVLLAWDRSLTDPPHTNGAYALFTDAADVPVDAEEVHRITAATFPLMSPVLLSGSPTGTLTGVVTVRYDDPTNPFLHRYQPMHDNRDWDFVPYTNAVETRTICRTLTFTFGSDATNAPANPYWSADRLSGVVTETCAGLRAQPILSSGSFVFQRISRIADLQ
ncbi:MAG: hypothetical protein EOM20_07495 [Spartobacteria bacterium]|nr:hypothetical protein [Spartobacteria bacterium]